MKQFKLEDITFKVTSEEEFLPVRGNLIVSDDSGYDEDCENYVLDQLVLGNKWAWCTIKVTAIWEGIEGSDTLGACSYDSEMHFLASSEYQDMRQRAYENLLENLLKSNKLTITY